MMNGGLIGAARRLFVLGLAIAVAGCGAPTIDDPEAAFRDQALSERTHLAAMGMMDTGGVDDAAYNEALERAIWRPGYSMKVREAAFVRLEERDLPGLKQTIRRQLPQTTDFEIIRWLSAEIADRGWEDLTPALVSSLARPATDVPDDRDRPEYKALVALYGDVGVTDAIYQLFMTANKPSQQGLRTRCWDLLIRLGERERLVALLESSSIPADDAFLLDLQAAARDLGLVPRNREEILWLRRLRDPGYTAFWGEAVSSVGRLSAERRMALEVRDLPIVVSAARHQPELLTASDAEVYETLVARINGRTTHEQGGSHGGFGTRGRYRVFEWRKELTWGDMAAMHMAIDAIDVSEVQTHLYDYAERDRGDTTTEYGGVIQLDAAGRFEIVEFPPRIRRNDQTFIASQAMMDSAYTSLFHFHYHVQRYRNEEYAGPGMGDREYATNVGANCLVFTFVDEDAMNVDYYRRNGLQVDLGELARP